MNHARIIIASVLLVALVALVASGALLASSAPGSAPTLCTGDGGPPPPPPDDGRPSPTLPLPPPGVVNVVASR